MAQNRILGHASRLEAQFRIPKLMHALVVLRDRSQRCLFQSTGRPGEIKVIATAGTVRFLAGVLTGQAGYAHLAFFSAKRDRRRAPGEMGRLLFGLAS